VFVQIAKRYLLCNGVVIQSKVARIPATTRNASHSRYIYPTRPSIICSSAGHNKYHSHTRALSGGVAVRCFGEPLSRLTWGCAGFAYGIRRIGGWENSKLSATPR